MDNQDSEKNKLEELIKIQKQIEDNLKYIENNYQDLTNYQIQQLTDLMRKAEDSLTSEEDETNLNNNLDDIDLDKI